MFLKREKTTPKPTPPFWRNVNIYSSFRQFGNVSETLSPAFHAGNRGSNPLGDAIWKKRPSVKTDGLFYCRRERPVSWKFHPKPAVGIYIILSLPGGYPEQVEGPELTKINCEIPQIYPATICSVAPGWAFFTIPLSIDTMALLWFYRISSHFRH